MPPDQVRGPGDRHGRGRHRQAQPGDRDGDPLQRSHRQGGDAERQRAQLAAEGGEAASGPAGEALGRGAHSPGAIRSRDVSEASVQVSPELPRGPNLPDAARGEAAANRQGLVGSEGLDDVTPSADSSGDLVRALEDLPDRAGDIFQRRPNVVSQRGPQIVPEDRQDVALESLECRHERLPDAVRQRLQLAAGSHGVDASQHARHAILQQLERTRVHHQVLELGPLVAQVAREAGEELHLGLHPAAELALHQTQQRALDRLRRALVDAPGLAPQGERDGVALRARRDGELLEPLVLAESRIGQRLDGLLQALAHA